MTSSTSGSRDPTTDQEFSAALSQLLLAAYANGLDVEGGWAFQTDEQSPDWGVEIYEVEYGTATTN